MSAATTTSPEPPAPTTSEPVSTADKSKFEEQLKELRRNQEEQYLMLSKVYLFTLVSYTSNDG